MLSICTHQCNNPELSFNAESRIGGIATFTSYRMNDCDSKESHVTTCKHSCHLAADCRVGHMNIKIPCSDNLTLYPLSLFNYTGWTSFSLYVAFDWLARAMSNILQHTITYGKFVVSKSKPQYALMTSLWHHQGSFRTQERSSKATENIIQVFPRCEQFSPWWVKCSWCVKPLERRWSGTNSCCISPHYKKGRRRSSFYRPGLTAKVWPILRHLLLDSSAVQLLHWNPPATLCNITAVCNR